MKYKIKQVGIKHIDWVGLILSTEMPSQAKMLAMYLSRFMNKDQDVAWPSIGRICAETSLSKSTVCKYLELLSSEGWILRDKGSPVTTTRYHVTFPKIIEDITSSATEILGCPSHGLGLSVTRTRVVRHTDTNRQYNNKDNSSRFTPPTLDTVQSYCNERNNNVNAQKFIDFYSSKGWMVGKNKMKDWKAAVRTWESRDKSSNPNVYEGAI